MFKLSIAFHSNNRSFLKRTAFILTNRGTAVALHNKYEAIFLINFLYYF